MKVDYKILWLDDKMDIIIEGDYDEEIREYLVEEGFNPVVETVSTEKAFFEKLDDTFDLILTDYHLNESRGVTRDGDKIIEEIRGRSIFTEIMFYSAQGEVIDTVKLDRITFVDTRKSTIRNHNDTIVDRAKKLINLTVKKFQNIVIMRGMIMNETSTLDSQMLEIIKIALKRTDINFDELASHIYDELNNLYKEKNDFVDDCRARSKFSKLTKDNFVFSADYKIKTLGKILSSLNLDDFSEKYKEDINSLRNKFAHAVLLKGSDGREYFKHGESGLTFDEALCRKIRIDINKYRVDFDKTLQTIQEEQID